MGRLLVEVGRAAVKGRVAVRVVMAAAKRVFQLECQQTAAVLDTSSHPFPLCLIRSRLKESRPVLVRGLNEAMVPHNEVRLLHWPLGHAA